MSTQPGVHSSCSILRGLAACYSVLWYIDCLFILLLFCRLYGAMLEPRIGPAAPFAGAFAGGLQLDARNVAGLCAAFLVSTLAASAGVGGGAFFVPIFMVFLSFSLKEATVLSQASIAAVSLASILFNLPKRHPVYPASQTLINYELCLTMTPALLLGVSIGVEFNRLFPTWLITTLLVCVLTYMSVRTTQKGLQQWHNETAQRQQDHQQGQQPQQDPLGTDSIGQGLHSSRHQHPQQDSHTEKLATKRYPIHMLLGVMLLWTGFAGLQLLRQHMQGTVTAYYAVVAAQVVFGAGCSLGFAYALAPSGSASEQHADDIQQPLIHGNNSRSGNNPPQPMQQPAAAGMQPQRQNMVVLVVSMLKVALAGTMAGLLGIGGGMLMGPMLLASGVHPQSSAATSNILVFMSSSSAALAFLLVGRVKMEYAAAFCSVCGAASLAGLTVFGTLVRKSGRPSILVLLLAFIMGAGAACSGVFGYIDAWHQAHAGSGANYLSML
eukprot:GHRR01021993.1.p1 GENE.GHRR01021993.1~~GHRR01021993.1.p1  ORF type:complete len:495 (+),score=150.04 GHRR01021993.1:450-1934(+)